MATFTQRNFPADYGNDVFVGAGERTCYVPQSLSQKCDGFLIERETVVYGPSSQEVKPGNPIWFTYPPKLFSGEEIGLSRGIYAQCSTSGSIIEPEGYIRISAVRKPSPPKKGRVAHGETTQEVVASRVKEISDNIGISYNLVSIAPVGSQAPDLVVKLEDQTQQFEIKGQGSASAPITLFDKSARREKYPDFLDDLAECYIEGIDYLKEDMTKLKMPMSFLGIMDYYRRIENTVGFAGDVGVVKSGKLPSDLKTSDSYITKKIDGFILDHFHESKDNYFTVFNRSSNDMKIYHTDYGDNILGVEDMPPIKRVELATYGGASGGATRIGLRIKL